MNLLRASIQRHAYLGNLPFVPLNVVLFEHLPLQPDEPVGVVTNMELRKVTANSIVEPSFCMAPDHAQELMDQLWACGLRPTAGIGQAGAMEAVQAHLKDLQEINKHWLECHRKSWE